MTSQLFTVTSGDPNSSEKPGTNNGYANYMEKSPVSQN